MKKLIAAFLLLLGSSAFASDEIAIVDLGKIVENSTQVRQLKQEHSKKIADLDRILVNARGEISNEKDPAKILMLEDKYMKEFNTKREALEKDYSEKISIIEKNIKDEVAKKAHKEGYEYVFAKSVVLYGGKDITNELINSIK